MEDLTSFFLSLGLRALLPAVMFCLSCLPALLFLAAKARQYGRAAMYGLFMALFALPLLPSWLTSASKLSTLGLAVLFVGVASICLLGAPSEKKLRFRRAIATANVLLGLMALTLSPFTIVLSRSLKEPVAQSAKSPDGRYEANRVFHDGVTDSHFFATLKPTRFSLRDALDYPYTRVAATATHGISNVRWVGNRALLIEYDPDDLFTTQEGVVA